MRQLSFATRLIFYYGRSSVPRVEPCDAFASTRVDADKCTNCFNLFSVVWVIFLNCARSVKQAAAVKFRESIEVVSDYDVKKQK